jgi:hypothetical protein
MLTPTQNANQDEGSERNNETATHTIRAAKLIRRNFQLRGAMRRADIDGLLSER